MFIGLLGVCMVYVYMCSGCTKVCIICGNEDVYKGVI